MTKGKNLNVTFACLILAALLVAGCASLPGWLGGGNPVDPETCAEARSLLDQATVAVAFICPEPAPAAAVAPCGTLTLIVAGNRRDVAVEGLLLAEVGPQRTRFNPAVGAPFVANVAFSQAQAAVNAARCPAMSWPKPKTKGQ